MNEWILVVMVIITEGFLHYIPWMKLLRGKELPRLAAYVLGMLGMMLPFTVWLIQNSETHVVLALWKVIVSGGLIVFALYGLDHYLELTWRDMEASERETHAKK